MAGNTEWLQRPIQSPGLPPPVDADVRVQYYKLLETWVPSNRASWRNKNLLKNQLRPENIEFHTNGARRLTR